MSLNPDCFVSVGAARRLASSAGGSFLGFARLGDRSIAVVRAGGRPGLVFAVLGVRRSPFPGVRGAGLAFVRSFPLEV